MPSTHRFQEALNAASDVAPRGIGSGKDYLACNMALAHVWKAYNWRQSLADLPPFYLMPSQQDYGPPWISVPADFAGLRRAYHWDLSGDNARPVEMVCVNDLAAAGITTWSAGPDRNEYISYYEPSRKFRILPVPTASMGAPYHIVDGVYKKVPTVKLASGGTANKIEAANIANAVIPFDDMYLEVMIEALRWALMVLMNDPKAGPTQIQGTSRSWGGQRATMDAAIHEMARQERIEMGEKPVFPRESLAMRGYGW